MSKRINLLLALVFSACFGCGGAEPGDLSTTYLRRWVGKMVVVQFRRDALGAAAEAPVSPTTGSFNGANVHVVGVLKRVEADSVYLEQRKYIDDQFKTTALLWIPREAILLVRADPPPSG